jgi:TRAP-type uncharacterized transport system substrate-binding protein
MISGTGKAPKEEAIEDKNLRLLWQLYKEQFLSVKKSQCVNQFY